MGAALIAPSVYSTVSDTFGHGDSNNRAPQFSSNAMLTGLELDTEYVFMPIKSGEKYGLKYIDDDNVENCDHCRQIGPTNNLYQSTVMFVNNNLSTGKKITTQTPFAILVMMRVYDDDNEDDDSATASYEVFQKDGIVEPRYKAMWVYNGKADDFYEMVPYNDSEDKSNFEMRGQFFARPSDSDSVFSLQQYIHSERQDFGINGNLYAPVSGDDLMEDRVDVFIRKVNEVSYPGISMLQYAEAMFANTPPNEAISITSEGIAPETAFSEHWYYYLVVGLMYLAVWGVGAFMVFYMLANKALDSGVVASAVPLMV